MKYCEAFINFYKWSALFLHRRGGNKEMSVHVDHDCACVRACVQERERDKTILNLKFVILFFKTYHHILNDFLIVYLNCL